MRSVTRAGHILMWPPRTVDEVLLFAKEGVWEAEQVEAWVPKGKAADNGEDTDGEASSDSEDDT
jgi:hypothetical protein